MEGERPCGYLAYFTLAVPAIQGRLWLRHCEWEVSRNHNLALTLENAGGSLAAGGDALRLALLRTDQSLLKDEG